MKIKKEYIYDLIFFVCCLLALVHGHDRILTACDANTSWGLYVRVLLSACLDASLVMIVSHLVCCKSRKWAYFMSAMIISLWCMVNIIFSIHMKSYMPLSAIASISSLKNLDMVAYITDSFVLSDVKYLLFLALPFVLIRIKNVSRRILSGEYIMLGGILFASILLPIVKTGTIIPNTGGMLLWPNNTIAHSGFFRGQVVYAMYNGNGFIELTDEQTAAIEEYIAGCPKMACETPDTSLTNTLQPYTDIIFILTETQLSSSGNLTLEGREVTPFLNSLRRDSRTYYNDSVTSNASIGRSSDGQYVYMTGMLPLNDVFTVTIAKDSKVLSLAELLRNNGYKTYMTIPTERQMWLQNYMCERYAIDSLYSYEANGGWLNDHDVVDYAMKNDQKMAGGKHFHMVLTSSTHSPYDEIDEAFTKCKCMPRQYPKHYTPQYVNYLKVVHYMDHELKRYVEHVKNSRLFTNPLIIIASDHGWLEDESQLPDEVNPNSISVIMHNMPENIKAYHNNIQQLDVYTSLIDLLIMSRSIDKHTLWRTPKGNQWQGLGCSIFTSKQQQTSKPHNLITLQPHNLTTTQPYRTTVNDQSLQISSDILKGRFFK